MIIQLDPQIPVTTPKGDGYAHFIIDYSMEHDLYWVVFINDSGECWTYNNKHIRLQKNITLDRKATQSFDNDCVDIDTFYK